MRVYVVTCMCMYKYVTSVLEGLFFEMTKKKKFWRIKPTAYTSFDGLDRSQGPFFFKAI